MYASGVTKKPLYLCFCNKELLLVVSIFCILKISTCLLFNSCEHNCSCVDSLCFVKLKKQHDFIKLAVNRCYYNTDSLVSNIDSNNWNLSNSVGWRVYPCVSGKISILVFSYTYIYTFVLLLNFFVKLKKIVWIFRLILLHIA